MSVWLTIPTARPVEQAESILSKWRAKGYRIAVFCNAGSPKPKADLVISGDYPGYYRAVNALTKAVIASDGWCEWCVAAGDDMEPDEKSAGVIAAAIPPICMIMQPTGDDWADANGRLCERICGSPWLSRAWIIRGYHGAGPLPRMYNHYFGDEELLHVAKRWAHLAQLPGVTQRHNHWTREGKKRPEHLESATARWQEDRQTFELRKAEDFPGSEI